MVIVEQECKDSNEGSRNTFSYLIVRALVSGTTENNTEEDSQIDVVNVLGQGLTCREKWGRLSGRRIAATRRNDARWQIGKREMRRKGGRRKNIEMKTRGGAAEG